MLACTCTRQAMSTHDLWRRVWAGQGDHQCRALCEANLLVVQPVLTPPSTPWPIRALYPLSLEPSHPTPLSAAFSSLKPQLSYLVLIHQISLLSSCLQPYTFSILLIPSLPSQLFSNSLGEKKPSFTGTLRCAQFMAEHTRCLSNIRKHPNWNRNYFLSTFIHIKARVSMT